MSGTSRERFVEAMRESRRIIRWRDVLLSHDTLNQHDMKVRQAAEAFADAVCEETQFFTPNDEQQHHSEHNACRAALLREIGL